MAEKIPKRAMLTVSRAGCMDSLLATRKDTTDLFPALTYRQRTPCPQRFLYYGLSKTLPARGKGKIASIGLYAVLPRHTQRYRGAA
jgi:hypothetical protein